MFGINLILNYLALGFLLHAGFCQCPEADVDDLVSSESVDLFQVVTVMQVEIIEEFELHFLPLVVLIDLPDFKATGGQYFLLRELYLYWFLLLLRYLQLSHALHDLPQHLLLLLQSNPRVVVLLFYLLEVEDKVVHPAEVELIIGSGTG